jgi:hypothetical protein
MAWNFICVRCQSISDKEFNYCDNCGAMNSAAYFQKNKEEQSPVPCTCPSCLEENKQKEKHFNHQFYIDARKIWTTHQQEQIKKGAEKYPEPFTPSSWTNEQLVEHALQENVDQLHYIVGMKERMEEQEQRIKDSENQIKAVEKNADHWYDEYKQMEIKYTSKLNEYEFLFEQTGKQQKKIIELSRKDIVLKAMVDRIQAALNSGKITADVAKFLMDNREKGEF